MNDNIQSIADDFDDLLIDVKRTTSLSILLWHSMADKYTRLDFERYECAADTISNMALSVENKFKQLMERLNFIADNSEHKNTSETRQSTQR